MCKYACLHSYTEGYLSKLAQRNRAGFLKFLKFWTLKYQGTQPALKSTPCQLKKVNQECTNSIIKVSKANE